MRARLLDVSARALASGALVPLATDPVILPEAGLRFQIRVARLDPDRRRGPPGPPRNPFLPPEPELVVGELGPDHLAVLNKFKVIDEHLLILTRRFVPQEDVLDLADFEALARAQDALATDLLAFYNGGPDAGASQPHRHLQLVPLPLDPAEASLAPSTAPNRFPTEALLLAALSGVAPPFPVAVVPAPAGAAATHAAYLALLDQIGAAPAPGARRQGRPYNLLLTERLLALVPRAREGVIGVGLNALAYAGSLLVRDAEALARVRAHGVLPMLREACG